MYIALIMSIFEILKTEGFEGLDMSQHLAYWALGTRSK